MNHSGRRWIHDTHGYLGLFRHREFRALWTGSALGVAAATKVPLFADRQDLVLVEATAFENGVALLRYEIYNTTASER